MNNPVPGLETKSSGLAVFLSMLFPGLGHLYLGKIFRGIAMLLPAVVLDWLVYAELSGPQLTCFTAECFHEYHIEGLWLLGFLAAAFAWWVWGMVSADRLCRKHNALALLLYHRMFQNG